MNTNYLKKLREADNDNLDTNSDADYESANTDEKVDDLQYETSTEGEEDSSELDNELSELRDILPDIDLNLYQIISKENPNDIFYIIGKILIFFIYLCI